MKLILNFAFILSHIQLSMKNFQKILINKKTDEFIAIIFFYLDFLHFHFGKPFAGININFTWENFELGKTQYNLNLETKSWLKKYLLDII